MELNNHLQKLCPLNSHASSMKLLMVSDKYSNPSDVIMYESEMPITSTSCLDYRI